MIQYILQTILFQLIFLLVYEFFLRKETFFNWNRAYLLITSILSFVLPLIKIQAFSKVVPQEYIFQLPTVVIGEVPQEEISSVLEYQTTQIPQGFQWQWDYLLWVGIALSLLILIFKITKILGIIRRSKVYKHSNISLVKLKNSNAAFSFFNYVFIGENIADKEQDIILKHELVHVNQKHSLDLLFFEILRVLFWYNPLIYIYQSKLRVLHEFIADKEALKTQDKATYYQNLLMQIFDTQNVSFINTFYKKSLIKKRIVMLQKSKSNQLNLAKYLVVLPLLFVMLAYNAAFAQEQKGIDENHQSMSLESQSQEKIIESMSIEESAKDTLSSKDKMNIKVDAKKDRIPTESNEVQVVEEIENLKSKYKEVLAREATKDENVSYEERIFETEVPFAVIDQTPLYPECKDLSKEEQRKCFAKNISLHVNKNFNVDLANELGLSGKQRINVIFKINKQGNVTGIRARAPHPALEEEAKRVVAALPKMIPGKHKGKTVVVPYSLPIIFEIVGKNKPQDDIEVPFAVIDQIPLYQKCVELTKAEQKKCVSNTVSEYVAKNFNTKLANESGLVGKHKINVMFKIDKNGNVTGVRARSKYEVLEKEAIRVVASLPKMIPGKHKGKAVVVPYSLPIMFHIPSKSKE